VTRGRGDAALQYGEESPELAESLAPKALPPGAFLDLEHSAIAGVGKAAPQANPQNEAAGASSTSAADGRTAWKRRLKPRHREAVKAFFEPADAKKP